MSVIYNYSHYNEGVFYSPHLAIQSDIIISFSVLISWLICRKLTGKKLTFPSQGVLCFIPWCSNVIITGVSIEQFLMELDIREHWCERESQGLKFTFFLANSKHCWLEKIPTTNTWQINQPS